ncbi:MAG: hypothetical protein R6U46_05350, partial [Marinilabilia sp.]
RVSPGVKPSLLKKLYVPNSVDQCFHSVWKSRPRVYGKVAPECLERQGQIFLIFGIIIVRGIYVNSGRLLHFVRNDIVNQEIE